MNPQNIRIKEAMDTLLKMFDEDNLEKVARAVFKGSEIPSDKWSFLNRLLMYLNNIEDARGFRQWQEAGRYVKKGSKAFYIIAPMFKKVEKTTKTKTETEAVKADKQIIEVLAGFKGIPVFRFEDIEGEPIIREQYKVEIPCKFNGIIQELGLTIQTMTYSGCYGWYRQDNKEIRLATPEIKTFLHELSHAVDDRLHGLKRGQHNDQEVTAEFSGAVIGYLMGYKIPFGNVKEYIKGYNFKELMKCLDRIEKIVNFVIERTTAGIAVQSIPCMREVL